MRHITFGRNKRLYNLFVFSLFRIIEFNVSTFNICHLITPLLLYYLETLCEPVLDDVDESDEPTALLLLLSTVPIINSLNLSNLSSPKHEPNTLDLPSITLSTNVPDNLVFLGSCFASVVATPYHSHLIYL